MGSAFLHTSAYLFAKILAFCALASLTAIKALGSGTGMFGGGAPYPAATQFARTGFGSRLSPPGPARQAGLTFSRLAPIQTEVGCDGLFGAIVLSRRCWGPL
jgi:hypothetical protein